MPSRTLQPTDHANSVNARHNVFPRVSRLLESPDRIAYSEDMPADFRDVDPAELRLPGSRSGGADLYKLQQQIAQHGASVAGMPPLLAYEGSDGVLELADGVTRATRMAKLLPGTTVRVEVLGKLRRPKAQARRIGDAL
jgi:hypothetical protein